MVRGNRRLCAWLGAKTGGITGRAEIFGACLAKPSGTRGRAIAKKRCFRWQTLAAVGKPGYADRCTVYWKTGPEPVGRADANAYGL